MQRSTFEGVRPSDYLNRLANSDIGKSYKAIATSEEQLSILWIAGVQGARSQLPRTAKSSSVRPAGTWSSLA
jgi:hypothetical protein